MKKIFFQGKKGKICGVVSEPKVAASSKHKLAVLMLHGLFSSKDSKAIQVLEKYLNSHNITTFRFDFYGHGESEGELSDITLSTAVSDGEKAISILKNKGYGKIGIFGSSFGGAVALILSSRQRENAFTFLKAPVSDYNQQMVLTRSKKEIGMWKNRGYLEYTLRDGTKKNLKYGFYADLKKFDCKAIARKITSPVLIIHGTADKQVPIIESRNISKIIKKCELREIAGGDHGLNDPDHFKKMIGHILEFLKRNIIISQLSAENVIIKDEKSVSEKIIKMKKAGMRALHVITDFDKTLTPFSLGGGKASSFDPLDKGINNPEFARKKNEMQDYYYPIETSIRYSLAFKKRKMDEWWRRYFEAAIECGMKESIIKKSVRSHKMELRKGTQELMAELSKKKIPLMIFSAGMGDIIEEYLKIERLNTSNVHLVSNFFIFNKIGKAIGFTKPQVHVFNKNEGLIKSAKYKSQIAGRKNVILIGDSLGDTTMADGMKHDCTLKIGFCNMKGKERLEKYKEAFDIVIINNGDMNPLVELVRKISG